MSETLKTLPEFTCKEEVFRKPGGELNQMKYRAHLLEFANVNKLPVRDVFKQFVKEHFLAKENITGEELMILAYRLSSKGDLTHGLMLAVHALDITPENAAEIFPKLFPSLHTYDMIDMGAVWEMEDLLGWPRGTTFPEVRTWG